MKYLSLFSGIEAASVAWERLGWQPVAFCEIDEFPCAVLSFRYPSVPNLGDITKIEWEAVIEQYGTVDLIIGGSPCQSFSIAGGREGLDGESRLMYEYIRAVQDVRPTWLLWENVPGVFSTDAGRAFGVLLDALEKCGYVLAWRVLDAQFFGVAQRRRRVFLIGHLGGPVGIPAAVLFNAESVSGNIKPSKEKRQELARPAEKCIAGSDLIMQFDTTQITSKANRSKPEFGRECHTLCASADVAAVVCLQSDGTTSLNSNGAGYCLDGSAYTLNTVDHQSVLCVSDDQATASIIRRLTPTEYERLQGFHDGWTDISYKGKEHPPDGVRYKALGNSMAVPVIRWLGERIQQVDDIVNGA